jgi:hypothetical protein
MDATRFDAWTRRRFGTTAVGAIAGLLSLAERRTAAGKKKGKKRTRKRNCEKLGSSCNPRNNKRVCCGVLFCQNVPELGGYRCCKSRFEPCARNAHCCANLTCVGTVNRFCDT